jgi:DNA repair exonuclease SbcCD ATPase subunit
MIYTQLSFANFFSVADEISIPLRNQGLVLITGENHDSSAASSNGAGKSTIPEVINWIQWGKTVRGESKDEVINRAIKKDCYGFLSMVDKDVPYTIKRYRNHSQFKNGLQLWSGDTDISEGTPTLTQEKINTLLGIDFESFIRGPMMPQGYFKRFSQMTDSEQKVILENAVQLGAIPAALEEAKRKINAEDATLQTLVFLLRKAESGLDQSKTDLERLHHENENLKVHLVLKKAEQLSELHAAICDFETAWDEWETPVDLTELEATYQKIDALENQIRETWDKDIEDETGKCAQKDSECSYARRELNTLRGDHQAICSLKPGTLCPTCRQLITEEHASKCSEELRVRISLKEKSFKQIEKDLKGVQLSLKTLKEKKANSLLEAASIKNTMQENLNKAKRQFANHQNRTYLLEASEKQIKKARQTKVKEPDPLDSIIKEKETQIQNLSKEILDLRADISKQESVLKHLYFWRFGFSNSGLKSKILSSVTPFLNDHVDTYIRELTDGELSVHFNTQIQLKNGNTQEQFSVEVTNENGAKTYDGSSGGEKARADLAINFALSDLYSARSKKSYPQRWFDEPFESLDEAGIEAVMEMLIKMVPSCGSIFVISHQAHFQSLFSKVITVSKRNGITELAK